MSNPYPAFADLKTDDIVVKSLSQNKGGKGQSCFIDINPKFGNSLTAPKDLRSLWNIKPSGESVDDVFSFNIELALPPEGERSDGAAWWPGMPQRSPWGVLAGCAAAARGQHHAPRSTGRGGVPQ